MKNTIKLLAASLVIASAAVAQAAPTIDGVLNVADGYGAPVKVYADSYINGADATNGTNAISTYFTFDAQKVYGVIHLDSTTGSPLPQSNVYLYSSGSLTPNNTTGLPGVYGDGNDIIAEGTNGWGFSTPAGGMTPHNAYNAASVNYVSNGTNTVEFSIDRSLLGDYSSFRYGGQFFGYEFHRGTGDRIPGAIVAVPEPATLTVLGAAGALAFRRRRA